MTIRHDPLADAFSSTGAHCDRTRRAVLAFLTSALGAATLPLAARAQGAVPILKIIVGFPAGAGVDLIARQLAERLRGTYAAAVIVENKAGAGGRLALEAIKQAPPDGTAIMMTPASPITLYPHIYRKLGYDPVADLAPLTTTHSLKMALIAGPSNPANSLAEYLAWAAKDEKNRFYATPAPGSVPHFIGVMLAKASGVQLVPVHYRGSAPAWQDLLGGHVPSYLSPLGNDAIARHKSGEARVLAITGAARTKALPNVPTFAEGGFKDIVIEEWFGLFAPAKTRSDAIAALEQALRVALQSREFVEFLAGYQSEPQISTPVEFAARIRVELDGWAPVVQASGFTADE
jgi:tripartite-type tricarboxylate transporter receptor subunit TctC